MKSLKIEFKLNRKSTTKSSVTQADGLFAQIYSNPDACKTKLWWGDQVDATHFVARPSSPPKYSLAREI